VVLHESMIDAVETDIARRFSGVAGGGAGR